MLMATRYSSTYALLVTLQIVFLSATAQNADWVISQELIFPLQEKHVHGSSIVDLPNGDLLAVWFEGSGERQADDVLIKGARMLSGARSWSHPFTMADTPNLPDCNPVIFLNNEGKLFLIWIAVQANRWENSILRVRTTDNYTGEGAPQWQWQDNILLKPGDAFAKEVTEKLDQLPEQQSGWAAYAPPYDKQIKEASKNPTYRSLGWMTRIPPLVLPGGRILLPLYSDGLNLSMVAISDDQGQSWYPSAPIVGRGPIQPSLVQKRSGDIIAYMRDSGDAPPRVQISRSIDEAQSWTPATKSDIPNTASILVKKIEDGRWILIGNVIEDGRYQLMLWISEDEGVTWPHQYFLENHNRQDGKYSYPSAVQSNDGHIHITYSYHPGEDQKSIKHIEIDPNRF